MKKNYIEVASCINIINSNCRMEKITFRLWLQKDKRDEYWEKWDCTKPKDS